MVNIVESYVTEPARSVKIIHRCEVLVVGSGPSGLAAAIAAARAGAEVTLVERYGCFGGNITAVGVEGFAWYRHQDTVEAGGLAAEFEEVATQMGATIPESQSRSAELDSEGFKVVADVLVRQAGVYPMLHRQFVAPILDANNAITGIITESKAGREAILAKRVIDATGDADVAHRSGVTTTKTQLEKMQAASVIFHIAGVNKGEFLKGVAEDPQTYSDWSDGEWTIETSGKEDKMYSPYLKKPFSQAIECGRLSADLHTIGGTWGAVHDSGELTYLNLIHLPLCDGTNPDHLTHFEMLGRSQAMEAISALRAFTRGCENARLRNFGMTLGIRDTRKIDSTYNLTESDVRNQARFDDSIGIYPEFIDGYGVLILPTTGRYMHIPYRSLLPKNCENLLVAGRAIGGDSIAHAATRNMSCCAVTGQAAGVAAAISVQSNTPLKSISIDALQRGLASQNVRFN